MKKTIIIPYHSNINALYACYYSIKKTIDDQTEVIIVANNADSTALNLDKSFFDCKILKYSENLYYPKAINIGAAYANGSILIFADADTYYLRSNWINNLVEPLLQNEGIVGYTSSKLLNPRTGRIIDFSISCTPYNFPHPYKNRKPNFALVKNNKMAFAACAASSAIKKENFIDCGGFNERLVHSYSDIDLCIKLRMQGLETMCVANSLVFHSGSSTTGSGMSSNMKEDTKGIFCADNHMYIKSDMERYIKESSIYALENMIFDKRYVCVNISTIANSAQYLQMYEEMLGIEIIHTYDKPYSRRDSDHIDLFKWLDYNIQSLKLPILYFVDDYFALQDNSMWKKYRDCTNDIIIDRNYNIDQLL